MTKERFKLANIVFNEDEALDGYPSLYYRAPRRVIIDKGADEVMLPAFETLEFTTYFNALSLRKWKKYTSLNTVGLHLELSGGACKIELTHVPNHRATERACKDSILEKAASPKDEFEVIEVEYPSLDSELLGFRITTLNEPCYLRASYYFTRVDETAIRPINMALITVTFNKEEFILSNISLVEEQLIGGNERVSDRLHFHVVDNGRTLDVRAHKTDKVTIHPNPNVGGSGGFARGMIEALKDDQVTHVLLMDDDVLLSTESIVRTFNLLSLINEEYREAFVSGAMLNDDLKDQQYEDLGRVDPRGFHTPVKPSLFLNHAGSIAYNEVLKPNSLQDAYAAWWYCCIPTATIREYGLPLPLFMREDDIEYSLRVSPRFMTMNGVCVWHTSFYNKYNPVIDRYLLTRNALITQTASRISPKVKYLNELLRLFQLELKRYNYDDAELLLCALEDYLEGPESLKQVRGEELLKKYSKVSRQPRPLSELEPEFGRLEVNISEMENIGDLSEGRSWKERIWDYLTFNGHRFVRTSSLNTDPVFVPFDGWSYPARIMHGHSTLIAVNPAGDKGKVRKLDKARFKQLRARCHKDMRRLRREGEAVAQAWQKAHAELTSREFWLWYLEQNK